VAPQNYYSAPYTYTITATFGGNPVAVKFLDNTTATNVSYGSSSYFKIANNGLGNGNFTITITPTWGSFAAETLTLANPGTCSTVCNSSSTNNVVTYYYASPLMSTDLNNVQALLPKFDAGTTRHLTKVKVDYGSRFSSGVAVEKWCDYLYKL